MTDIEARRLDLYNVLQRVLGNDPATTLMSHLPPIPVPNLLTKDEFEGFRSGEFANLRNEMREFKFETARRFEAMDARFEGVNKRIDRVLLAVVAGQFVLFAAIIGTALI